MSVDPTEKGVILIVDDTPTNLEILLDVLEDAGFKVMVSEDGESAIEMAEYSPPDLILLDILMPGFDGFETCRRLKTNKATQEIPVIFMTALTEKVDKVKGLNLGAVDYITKPLEHEEVLARINIHLSLRNLTKRLTEQNERLEQEISERKRAESLVIGQTRVLETIATGASLSDGLDSLARMIEEHSNGMLCSILLLD
ncbi:MAG: response regulator, partial [Cyanobacteriota bacterium]